MGNNNASQWYSCVPKSMWHPYPIQTNTSLEDQPQENQDKRIYENYSPVPENLLQAIVTDNAAELQQLVEANVDLNMPLNDKNETALILAVRLGHTNQVKKLIKQPSCDKNILNIKNCSALDVALIYTYNQRTELDPDVNHWEIIKALMSSSFEPICKDAMLYVIRTALKFGDTDFIYQLSDTAFRYCTSCKFHELLLLQFHRHQPVFEQTMDPIFESLSKFTIKLLCHCSGQELGMLVNSMAYYLESHWENKHRQLHLTKRLVLYATAAGWRWSSQHTDYIKIVGPHISNWCLATLRTVPSLLHICRSVYRQRIICNVNVSFQKLPVAIPKALKNYIRLKDVEQLYEKELETIIF